MNIKDIIKESFVFPESNLGPIAIYTVLTIVIGFFSIGGILYASNGEMIKGIIGIITFIIGFGIFIIQWGYGIKLIKSGIDSSDVAPEFEWIEDLKMGIKDLIVKLVYYVIPLLITTLTALITNIPGRIIVIINAIIDSFLIYIGAMIGEMFDELIYFLIGANTTNTGNLPPMIYVPDALIADLLIAILITIIVGIISFIIFTLAQFIAEARLAKTGYIGDALNIIEVFKDIEKIGIGKVIGTFFTVILIFLIVNIILIWIVGYVPMLGILIIIIDAYLIFFAYRATGLLYSEID